MNRRGFIAGTFALLGAWKLKLPWIPAASTPTPVIAPLIALEGRSPVGPDGTWEWKTFEFIVSWTKTPDGGTITESKWVENGKTLPLPELESADSAPDTNRPTTVVFRGSDQKILSSWSWQKVPHLPKTDGVA